MHTVNDDVTVRATVGDDNHRGLIGGKVELAERLEELLDRRFFLFIDRHRLGAVRTFDRHRHVRGAVAERGITEANLIAAGLRDGDREAGFFRTLVLVAIVLIAAAKKPPFGAALGPFADVLRRGVIDDNSRQRFRIASADYPDGLARLWSTLNAPNAGDVVVSLETGYECVDWGGTSHVGGGSHGALLAGDSLGPLLLCGLEPGGGETREQWTLRDVAGLVCDHFGIGDGPEVRAADVAGAVR